MIGIGIQFQIRLPAEKTVDAGYALVQRIAEALVAAGYVVESATAGVAQLPADTPMVASVAREENARLGFKLGEAK